MPCCKQLAVSLQKPLPTVLLLVVLVLGAPSRVAAQAAGDAVYRCGNSYSSKPCPGGAAVDATDTRSPAQQREASAAAQRDAALARQMQADRLATERAAPKGGAANVGPAAAKPPAKAASKPHKSGKVKKRAVPPAAASKPASSARP